MPSSSRLIQPARRPPPRPSGSCAPASRDMARRRTSFSAPRCRAFRLAQELMSICDLTIATGGSAMVKAAYSSGKPAYGVGAGNATMVIDETADIEEAARNTRLSKTSDTARAAPPTAILWWRCPFTTDSWSNCSANMAIWSANPRSSSSRQRCGMPKATAPPSTIARPAHKIAGDRRLSHSGRQEVPDRRGEPHIGKEYLFSSEKLSPVLAIFKYHRV